MGQSTFAVQNEAVVSLAIISLAIMSLAIFHFPLFRLSLQSISDIRPAFLDNQNGPYKQYGPISGNTLEEGPGEEVKGLISMEM